MAKNYAYESGVFRALTEMMRDRIREVAAADNESSRVWAMRNIMQLADQADEAIARCDSKETE